VSSRLVQVDCPVCGSAQSSGVYAVKDYVHRISDDTFGVRCCSDCGAGFLSPRPAAGDIGIFYPREFYWSFEKSAEVPLTAAELLARRSVQIENKLRCMAHLKPGRLLDIGAMKGEFLYAARSAGWQGEGVEFPASVPNLFDVPIRYGEFLDMDFEAASFNCVTMWAVLEHVYEPRAYAQKIASVLETGGTFIGLVTNFNSIQARWLRSDDFPRHLTMFTKSSLSALLREVGLQPVRMWTDQRLFGGALRGALTYGTKRLLGYEVDEAFYEMRDWRDPQAFCCTFRGRPSAAMRWVSRFDTASLWLPEKLLDLLGFGLHLGFEARKIPAVR
jgi:SAM-dependent methyltransferase